MKKALVNKEYLLEKIPGKGGWTYAAIPEISQNKNNPFGWVRVGGSIDGYEFEQYHLMPMGDGKLFLPVKSAIRKKIKKEAGDWVHIILYLEEDPSEIPEELWLCLEVEPKAHAYFSALSKEEQLTFVRWIYSAKTADIRMERINKSIDLLIQKKKLVSK
ncbi:MAG: YdeI/OmpD-associated family protein [Cytophagaceae bacterium]|nr:YdeI/OmpD-associated family protein [Cytophagaceae bacterium]